MNGKENSSKVKILGKSTSRGSFPVKPGKTHPLSALDRAMAAHSLHLVFYFNPAITKAAGMTRNSIKTAISELIMHYPAMAGRMTRPEGADGNWVIKCNDTGVRVLEAKVEGDMAAWLSSAAPEAEKELAQWERPGNDIFLWSPFTFQVSEFECGGMAIGLSSAHMFADATCLVLIVKALADCHRRACISHPPFFYPSALRNPDPNHKPNPDRPSVALLRAKAAAAAPANPATATATFRFSDESVRRCLERSGSVSPFEALAGLFWWRIAAGSGSKSLTLCQDFRKLMHVPLPYGYFGNAVHFSETSADLDGGGWSAATAAVKAHLAGFEEDEVWATANWLKSRAREEAFQMYGPGLTCASLDGLFVYDVAFGVDTAPCHVAWHVGGVEGEGLIVVLPGPPEAGPMGRTVMVTLPEQEKVRICRDPVILELGPTLLFESSA